MDTPSTTMSPFWKGSSALTVLISVDLPEPDGPQTTTTSPFLMAVVQSVSTWKLPYHLEMFLMSIMEDSWSKWCQPRAGPPQAGWHPLGGWLRSAAAGG